MLNECKHRSFVVDANVSRLKDSYILGLNVHCTQCGKRFMFMGLPVGFLINGASTSFNGLEARLAICEAIESDIDDGDKINQTGYGVV